MSKSRRGFKKLKRRLRRRTGEYRSTTVFLRRGRSTPRLRMWERLLDTIHVGDLRTATIKRPCEDGFVVHLEDCIAFLPSELREDSESLVGCTVDVRVTEIDESRRRINVAATGDRTASADEP